MDWKKVGALAVLVTSGAIATANAQETALVVRIFNNYRVQAVDLLEAKAHAAATLKAAGVNVVWLNCWHGDQQPADAPVRCREDVDGDLVLRLQRVMRLQRAAPGHSDRYVSLGFSVVMSEGMPFLATVHPDLAEGVARRAGVASGTVLGRAIAHEIGHLLLNTNSHPKDGLMRAPWSQRELQRDAARDWTFPEQEVATIQAAVANRSRERNEERMTKNE